MTKDVPKGMKNCSDPFTAETMHAFWWRAGYFNGCSDRKGFYVIISHFTHVRSNEFNERDLLSYPL